MKRSTLPWVATLIDLLLIAAAMVLAIRFRMVLPIFRSADDVLENTAVAGLFLVLAWIVTLAWFGCYDEEIFGAGTEEYRALINGSFATAAFVGISAFLLKFPLSRGFFVLLLCIGIPMLLLGRWLLRRAIHRARARGRLTQSVLLAGSPGKISEIAQVLRRESWLGYRVVGCVVPIEYAGLDHTSSGIPVLGLTDSISHCVDEHDIDIVFFTAGTFTSTTDLRRVAWELEDRQNVQIVVAPDVTDVSSERVRIRPVAGLPLMHLGKPRSRDAATSAKRLFDLFGSICLLILVSPLLLVVATWIKLADRGPVLFRQTRVGRDGEEFSCLKLRSMVVNAETILSRLPERDGHVLFKMEDDPRITRPGRFLRRFSIDELPQLWNVIRGEMSLVGPRPPLPSEVAQYEDDALRRLAVRPGMTGLWQVSGRSDLSWEDTVRLDLYYVDNWSMVQDLTILIRTVSAVIASRGAY